MNICSVCGSAVDSYLQRVSDPLTHEIFAVSKCKKCGLGHTVPRPTDLSPYYPEKYYGSRHGFTTGMYVRRRLRFVAATLPGNKGGRLLDIGCGDGAFLLAARAAGWGVTGTERNPAPARSSGLEVHEDVSLLVNTARFDCVTMWHTLEHMTDIPSVLQKIAMVLKPEGVLIIAVPDFGGLQARFFREHWLHLDVPRHLYHFDAKALDFCLNAAGFRVHRRWHQEFEYDLLGWSQSALNYLMPRHQNLFFDILTGRKGKVGTSTRSAAFILGALLSVLSLPLLTAGTLLGRGGSLIVAARPGFAPTISDALNLDCDAGQSERGR